MNILYVSLCYLPRIGGAENLMHLTAKEMSESGHRVKAIIQWSRWRRDWLWGSTMFSDPPKEYIYEGISVSQLGFPLTVRFKMLPWVFAYYGAGHLLMGPSVKRISSIMLPYFNNSSNAPDIIHALRAGREFLVQSGLFYCRNHDIPFVLTPLHHPRWSGPLYRVYDRIYSESDAIIALTEYEKKVLIEEKKIRAERIHVIGAGPILAEKYSVSEFREKYGIHGIYVLFLGRQVENKGFKALAQAAKLVWNKFSDVSFVFIGPETSQSRTFFRYHKDYRIYNLGAVDLKTKTSALAGCKLLCVPSMQESFGMIYSEAWSFGKAVIGGRIPPVACVIKDEKDGFLSSQNPGELAEKICYLLDNSKQSSSMGKRGKKKVQENFTWPKIAKKTLNVYNSLV